MDNRKSKFIISAFYFLVALFYTFPLFLRISWYGVHDWELFTCIAAIPTSSVMQYGLFPFWNPYMGGGNILFHHPEVGVLTPFFLLYMAFGAVIGLKLQIFFCYFIGLFGTHKLGRRLSLSSESSILFSIAYFGSVYFALHFAEGHMPFTHFSFLPWFLYYLLDDSPGYRSKILGAIILALMILGNGAAVPLLYTLLFASAFIALRAVQLRSFEEIYTLVITIIGGIGLSAIKFLPMTVYLFQNRWAGQPDESVPFSALGSIFFSIDQTLFTKNFDGQMWGWHEYGAYLSPILIIFALSAIVLRKMKYWPWYFLVILFLSLGLGNFGSFSPWALLTSLPGFSSTRCTGRLFQFVILSVAFLGGVGFDSLRERYLQNNHTFWKLLLLRTGLVVVIVTNLAFAWPILNSAMNRPPNTHILTYNFTQQMGSASTIYENFLSNRGSLITPWLSAYQTSRGIVGPDSTVYPEYVTTGELTVTKRRYTPNTIEYGIEATERGELVLGMGYDPGWSADDGRSLFPRNNLIALNFTPADKEILLSYRTPYFYHGLAISLFFTVLLLFAWYYQPSRQRS